MPTGGELAALAQPGADSSLASDRIYFVMTDRYANGDPSNDAGGLTGARQSTGYDPTDPGYFHGGDFKGLTGGCTDPVHGLQRIKSLGFNAIWVTPAVVNQVWQGDSAGYHGYWGVDFTRVDPHLGSDADFAAFVDCAHSLGMKVILDVVVNHTGDVIQLRGGPTYADVPYRDCHGKAFDPARYVGGSTFPCLSAQTMPRVPYFLPGGATAKAPAWLNDPLNYHDRGNIDFSSCSEQCLEQGDFFGLDDLFTEKPNVERGLAQIYSDWITRYKLDGFRVDTARHVNVGFFKLWVPQILAAAKSAGVNDFQIFGEVFISDTVEQSAYVRDRGLPSVLDFPFQSAASAYAGGGTSALALLHRLQDDDYYRLPDGADPTPPTFLGNHDMGRAAFQIAQNGGARGDELLKRTLLGYDLLYLLRGAPVVYYGDEVGMIGTGGDQAAREDMFPTQVPQWQTEPRVGSPPIGTGSSFDVTNNPIEGELKQLGALRDQVPALSTGWSVVRYAKGPLFVVSRIDPQTRTEYVAAFNNGDSTATATVPTSSSGAWTTLLGPTATRSSSSAGTLALSVPPTGALLLKADAAIAGAAPPKPTLTVVADPLSNLWAATATVSGAAPVSVAFAVRRAGSSAWQRLDVDTSPPFRGFIDSAKFKRNTRLSVVAIARGLDGQTAVSPVVLFRVRPHP